MGYLATAPDGLSQIPSILPRNTGNARQFMWLHGPFAHSPTVPFYQDSQSPGPGLQPLPTMTVPSTNNAAKLSTSVHTPSVLLPTQHRPFFFGGPVPFSKESRPICQRPPSFFTERLSERRGITLFFIASVSPRSLLVFLSLYLVIIPSKAAVAASLFSFSHPLSQPLNAVVPDEPPWRPQPARQGHRVCHEAALDLPGVSAHKTENILRYGSFASRCGRSSPCATCRIPRQMQRIHGSQPRLSWWPWPRRWRAVRWRRARASRACSKHHFSLWNVAWGVGSPSSTW